MSGMPGTPAWAWAGISFGSGCLCRGRHRCRTGGAGTIAVTSDEASLLQIVISLDDFAQLVLGPFVPPVGVGVVSFHQFLEPGLDLETLGGGRQIEGLERFQLQRPERPARLAGTGSAPGEKLVRIAKATAVSAGVDYAVPGAVGPGIGTHFPGRTVAGEAVLLVGLDLGIAHAGEVVVGGVEL